MKYKIVLLALLCICFLNIGAQGDAPAVVTTESSCTEVTSASDNVTPEIKQKIANFKLNDPFGYGMAITAMFVVFSGLLILFLFFKLVGKIASSASQRRAMKAIGYSKEEAKNRVAESGEVIAAIAMAISEITEEDHDAENTVLTMKNVERNYSPWSSKIYTLRELPKK